MTPEPDGRLAVSIEQARNDMIAAHDQMTTARRSLAALTYEIGQATIDVAVVGYDIDTVNTVSRHIEAAVRHRQQLCDAEDQFWRSYVIYFGSSPN